MSFPSGNIMSKFGMIWYGWFTLRSPHVDAVTVLFGNVELPPKGVDDFDVVFEIADPQWSARCEVVANNSFIGEHHDDAGGEALAPSLFRHEAKEVLWGGASQEVDLWRVNLDV